MMKNRLFINTVIAISSILIAISVVTSSSSSSYSSSAPVVYAQQTNNMSSMTTPTNNTTATEAALSPSRELVVIARDLEEIRDNLAEARFALNDGNYIGVLQHLNNIESMIRVVLTPGTIPGVSMMINPNETSALVAMPNMTSPAGQQMTEGMSGDGMMQGMMQDNMTGGNMTGGGMMTEGAMDNMGGGGEGS